MNQDELKPVYDSLVSMNKASGRNFEYGIFRRGITEEEIKKFLSSSMICTMENPHGERIGFFYNYLIPLPETKMFLSHQGLVVIFKNSGVDLITAPYAYANLLMHKHLGGDFYVSNISAVPLIIGAFTEIFDDVWPSINAKNVRHPPKDYPTVLKALGNGYIAPFFASSDVDTKRFVLKSPIEKMGFNPNIRELPRHENLMHNLFTSSWIDLAKGEDIIQIGKVTTKTLPKLLRLSQEETEENSKAA